MLIFIPYFQIFLLCYKVFLFLQCSYPFSFNLTLLFYHNFFFIYFEFFFLFNLILSISILSFVIIIIYNLSFTPEEILIHLFLQLLRLVLLSLNHFSPIQILLFQSLMVPFNHLFNYIELFNRFELISLLKILIFVHFRLHNFF